MSTDMKEGAMRPRIKTSRNEELIYADLAVAVRLLGNAAVVLEDALAEVCEMVTGSREADRLEAGKVHPNLNPSGDSEHTAWLEAHVFEPIYDLSHRASMVHRGVASVAAMRHDQWRRQIVSTPAVGSDPPRSAVWAQGEAQGESSHPTP